MALPKLARVEVTGVRFPRLAFGNRKRQNPRDDGGLNGLDRTIAKDALATKRGDGALPLRWSQCGQHPQSCVFYLKGWCPILVLSRKKNEAIIIDPSKCPPGELIKVVVVEIRADKTRLGIEANKLVLVDRLEVADAKRRNPNGRPVEGEVIQSTPVRLAG